MFEWSTNLIVDFRLVLVVYLCSRRRRISTTDVRWTQAIRIDWIELFAEDKSWTTILCHFFEHTLFYFFGGISIRISHVLYLIELQSLSIVSIGINKPTCKPFSIIYHSYICKNLYYHFMVFGRSLFDELFLCSNNNDSSQVNSSSSRSESSSR